MKSLNNYVNEEKNLNSLRIGINDSPDEFIPADRYELDTILIQKIDELIQKGSTVLDLTDIDVSNIDELCSLFNKTVAFDDRFIVKGTSIENKHQDIIDYLEKITEINMSTWDTSKATNMEYMFSGCYSLKSIDIKFWNTSNVINMERMFQGCTNLEEIDLSRWNVNNVETFENMFGNCQKLKTVGDLSNWKFRNRSNLDRMFNFCSKLEFIGDISNWNISNVNNINKIFEYCENLKNVGDLNNWDVYTNDVYVIQAFTECDESIIPDWYNIQKQNKNKRRK